MSSEAKLDFEQRQEASQMVESIIDDPEYHALLLIATRDERYAYWSTLREAKALCDSGRTISIRQDPLNESQFIIQVEGFRNDPR